MANKASNSDERPARVTLSTRDGRQFTFNADEPFSSPDADKRAAAELNGYEVVDPKASDSESSNDKVEGDK